MVLAATRALTPAQKPAAVTRRVAVAALAVGGTLASPARARRRKPRSSCVAVFAAVAADATVAGALLRLAFHDAVRRVERPGRAARTARSSTKSRMQRTCGSAGRWPRHGDETGRPERRRRSRRGGCRRRRSEWRSAHRHRPRPPRRERSFAGDAAASDTTAGDEARDVVNARCPSRPLDGGLRRYFRRVGLSDQELVALMGAHTLGRHNTLLNMTKACLRNLTRECLETAPVRAPFEARTPTPSTTRTTLCFCVDDRSLERGEANFIPTDVALS